MGFIQNHSLGDHKHGNPIPLGRGKSYKVYADVPDAGGGMTCGLLEEGGFIGKF